MWTIFLQPYTCLLVFTMCFVLVMVIILGCSLIEAMALCTCPFILILVQLSFVISMNKFKNPQTSSCAITRYFQLYAVKCWRGFLLIFSWWHPVYLQYWSSELLNWSPIVLYMTCITLKASIIMSNDITLNIVHNNNDSYVIPIIWCFPHK